VPGILCLVSVFQAPITVAPLVLRLRSSSTQSTRPADSRCATGHTALYRLTPREAARASHDSLQLTNRRDRLEHLRPVPPTSLMRGRSVCRWRVEL